MSVCLFSCRDTRPAPSDESTTEDASTPDENKQNKENDKDNDEKENQEASPKDEPTAWKAPYLELIERIHWDHCSYALVYVDGDEIPELYFGGSSEATGDAVYSYQNGTIVEQQLKRCGGGRYIAGSGKIINENGHMGYYYTDAYQLSERGFTQIFQGSSVERVEHLGNEEYRYYTDYFIEEAPVTEKEFNEAVNAVFDVSRSLSLDDHAASYEVIKQQISDWQKDDTTFLSQEVKNSWRSDLVAILSEIEVWDVENGIPGTYAVGLMDLNFDNIPEVLVAWPGGSMGNIFIEIYDLSTHGKLIRYNGANDDHLGIRLYVSKVGSSYVTLSTGYLRYPDIGSTWLLDQIPDTLESENGYLPSENLFAKAGYQDYFIGGQSVTEETYQEEYQKFLKNHTEISGTQIQMIRWANLDLSDKEGLRERMADALIQSSQKFIDFQG